MLHLVEVTAAYLGVGVIAGIFASLFGFGGGFLVVPIVLWDLAYGGLSDTAATHGAIATSLAVMIFNALNATQAHARRGNVRWDIYLRLAPFVAVGALMGVLGAGHLSGAVLRYTFVAFLGYTLVLALVRRDMVGVDSSRFRWPGWPLAGGFGVFLGAIAAALGVGGSVLSVPFLRRRGLEMKAAAALASPLSLPVSLVGTVTVLVVGVRGLATASGSIGLIYVPAVIGIALGTLLGVPVGVRIAHRLPDKLYATIYLGLLALTMLAVALGG